VNIGIILKVLCIRGRPLAGYWRRLAIDLWKKEAAKPNMATTGKLAEIGKSAEGDKATLLIGFNTMRGHCVTMPSLEEATKEGKEEDGDYTKNGSTTTRLKV
jgi:hypothetical protein